MHMNVHVFFSHTSTDKTIRLYKDGKIANTETRINYDRYFRGYKGFSQTDNKLK
jgi:hypothetical protein